MRLDKFLVHMGIGSRSQVKQFIKNGKVSVNGQTAKKADMAINEYTDTVIYENEILAYQQFVYYMLNKPTGVVSATHDNYERTVMNLIETTAKDVFPVGRLDKDTTGLLLLTNDGQLAHCLLSPKNHVDKVYIAHVEKKLTVETIQKFKDGIILADGFQCQSAILEIVDDTTARVTIREGKFHQVKRMFLACDNRVLRLKRVQMGSLKLDENLRLGEYRELTQTEVLEMRENSE